MSTNLVYQYYGAGISLGIYGSKPEVQRVANSLFNFRATESEPIWISEQENNAFAYVLTTWDKLKKGYKNIFLAARISKAYKAPRFRRHLNKMAEFKAEQRMSTILPESFLDDARSPEVFHVGQKHLAAILDA